MKKYFILAGLVTTVFFLYNCNPSRKATTQNSTPTPTPAPVPVAKAAPKTNYENQLKEVISANCSPCHIPSKGGNKRPYDNFANVKSDIDEMIQRISLTPAERGFMPFKGAKLSDDVIAVFKQWRSDGMLEK